MPVGGDITEVTYNHPTLGTGVFYPKSNESSNYDLGGIRKNDDANQVDGAGRSIHQMNRVRWSYELTVANDMNATNPEVEQANALAADPEEADWTFTHINGTVYGGKGSVVGDIQPDGNVATFTLKVAGGGKLAKVV